MFSELAYWYAEITTEKAATVVPSAAHGGALWSSTFSTQTGFVDVGLTGYVEFGQ